MSYYPKVLGILYDEGTNAMRIGAFTFLIFYRMKNIVVALLAGLCLVVLHSCKSESMAIRQMCEDVHRQYPKADLQDIYKTCYQDYFGSRHLVIDTATVRYYLEKELAECRDMDLSAMPRREPTGFRHRFTRVNLACVIDGELTEEQLLAMFIAAAGTDNAFGDNWAEEWQRIEQIALQVNPSWSNAPLQDSLRVAANNNRAVVHSKAFREAYTPHYRIVRNKK